MHFTVTRTSETVADPQGDVAVEGTLHAPGTRFRPYTLERLAVLVADGTYPFRLTVSSRATRGELWTPFNDPACALSTHTAHRNMLPEICDVPARAGIRAHALNEAKQSQGCVGVGEAHTATTISQSRVALEALCELLLALEARAEESTITFVTAIAPQEDTV